MKLSRKITIFIVLTLLTLIVLIPVTRHYYNWIDAASKYGLTAVSIGKVIGRYTEENDGAFPKSEQDLIDKNFLKKAITDGNLIYYLKHGSSDLGEKAYNECFHFGEMKISYGISIEQIELRKGMLYNKESGELFLLIDGPYTKDLMSQFYMRASVNLYESMLTGKTKILQAEKVTEK